MKMHGFDEEGGFDVIMVVVKKLKLRQKEKITVCRGKWAPSH